MNPERTAQIQAIRRKVLDGTATEDDIAEAVRLTREQRGVVATAVEAKVTRTRKAKAIDGTKLLDEFIGTMSD